MNDALEKLRTIRASLAQRDPLIVEARRQGNPWRAISDAIGLSRTQVETIARQQNGGQLPSPQHARQFE